MAKRVILTVGTKRGLFLLEATKGRGRWKVTGPLLKGVRRIGDRLHLHSLALRSETGTRRWVKTSVDAKRFSFEYRT